MRLGLTYSWVWQQKRLAASAFECPFLWMPAASASAPVEALLSYPSRSFSNVLKLQSEGKWFIAFALGISSDALQAVREVYISIAPLNKPLRLAVPTDRGRELESLYSEDHFCATFPAFKFNVVNILKFDQVSSFKCHIAPEVML
jgi:hypothetical protein